MSKVFSKIKRHMQIEREKETSKIFKKLHGKELPIVKKGDSYAFLPYEFVNDVPPGVYFPGINDHLNEVFLTKANITDLTTPEDFDFTDNLVETPSDDGFFDAKRFFLEQNYFPMENYVEPFKEVYKSINNFINKKDFYIERKIDYKRSILLYGDPGTGKTRFIANVCDKIIKEKNAIVIRIESVKHLEHFIYGVNAISNYLEGRLLVVVIEELKELLQFGNNSNHGILNVLDSTVLKNNLLYLITTNYPEEIPSNIINRPSRIDDMFGVLVSDFDYEFIKHWYQHLMGIRLDDSTGPINWIKKVEGKMSPAYLKELFLRSQMHNEEVEESLKTLRKRQDLIKNGFDRRSPAGFDYIDN